MTSARHPAMQPRRSRGFTLLELLVVMVILGLLVGYVGPKYFSQVGKSEVKAARAQIDAFEKALDQYRLDTGANTSVIVITPELRDDLVPYNLPAEGVGQDPFEP